MKVRVKDGQTLLDIAVMTTGRVEAAMEIAAANGLSVTAELSEGQELEVAEEPRTEGERRVVRRYAAEGVEPATEASAEERGECPYGGIGRMGIEKDFKVS